MSSGRYALRYLVLCLAIIGVAALSFAAQGSLGGNIFGSVQNFFASVAGPVKVRAADSQSAQLFNGPIIFQRGFSAGFDFPYNRGGQLVKVDPATGIETSFGAGSQPSYSYDGSRIAFTNDLQVSVTSASSYSPVGLKLDAGIPAGGSNISGLNPRWSPDGAFIAYNSLSYGVKILSWTGHCSASPATDTYGGWCDISHQLNPGGTAIFAYPSWHPTMGTAGANKTAKVIFVRSTDTSANFNQGNYTSDLYTEDFTVAPDGTVSNEQRLNVTNSPGKYAFPTFSHDGTKVAFVKFNSDDSSTLYVGDFGTTITNLKAITTYAATASGAAHHPVWSPDDTTLAFSDTNQIKKISPVVGATATDITTAQNSQIDLWPSWAPGSAPPPPSTTLSYDGRIRDRVSRHHGYAGIGSDGVPDGTFTVTLPATTIGKTIQSIDLCQRATPCSSADTGINHWDTVPADTGLWLLGVDYVPEGSSLLNAFDSDPKVGGSVANTPISNNRQFKLYVPDAIPTAFTNGTQFTVAVTLTDGTKASATTAVAASAGVDLGLIMTGPANNVATNTEFRYQLNATNYGNQTATNVRFVDTLPAGLTYVRNQYGNCVAAGSSNTGQTVTCTVDSIPPATYANVLLYVTTSQGQSYNNSASVVANESEPTPDTHSNAASATTNVSTGTDLSVTMDAPNQVANGAEITYKISVKNNTKDADAHGVTLTDTLPEGVTSASITGPAISSVKCDPFSNGKVICHLDNVERNIGYDFLLKLLPPRLGQIVNKANVTSNINPDPNLLNNDATQITAAKSVSDIAVSMDGPTQVQQGENATYLMTVKNIGAATAQDVRFGDAWSENADLVSYSPSTGSSIPNCTQTKDEHNAPYNILGCSLGPIGPGAQLTVRVTVHPRESGKVSNQAFAFSYSSNDDVGDSDDTNNTANRSTLACVAGAGGLPVFQKVGPSVASVNDPYPYQANATDTKGAHVTYSLAQSPSGMSINANTGLIDWRPTSDLINKTVQVTVLASNGTCNGTGTQTFPITVGDTPLGGFQLNHGSLQITSKSAVKITGGSMKQVKFDPTSKKPQLLIEDGTYKLGGDTKVNEFLSVEGDITIVVNKAADRIDFDINGGKGYLTNIPIIGTKVLWEGGRTKFTLNGQGVLSGIDQTGQFIQKLEAAKVGIGITNAQLLFAERGIRISGNVKLPAVPGIPGLTGNLQGLEISRQNGVVFKGQIELPTFDLGGFSIKGVKLDFQPDPGGNKDKDIFIGEGSLVVPNTVTVVGKVKLIGGAVDSVLANISVGGGGIPLIPPFLTLIGGTVSVEGLRTGQFSIFIGGDFTITDARLANVIKLSKAGIRYTAPGSISGSSDLEIFTFKVAQAGLGFFNIPNKKEFSFDADVTLIDSLPVLLVGASVKTGYSVSDTGAGFYFQGSAHGDLQIPNGKGFGYDLIRTFVGPLDPPRKIASIKVEVGFPPAQFSTAVNFPIVGDFHVAVRNVQVAAQNQVQVLVGRNLSELQKAAGANAPPAIKDSNYQSKMIKKMRPHDDGKDPLAQHSLYVPILSPNAPQGIGTVTVPTKQPKAFFRLLGGQGAPLYDIISPNGTRITPDNAKLNNAVFAQDVDSNQSFYVVTDPAAGVWNVEAEDGSTGPFVLDSASTDAAPVLTDVQVASQQNGTYKITYNAADVDTPTAHVSLYYSNDATSLKGTLIKDNLTPSASGTYTWTAGDGSVPSGDYSVYAVIDDDVNLPVQKYAPTPVHVVDSLAPAAPQNVTVVAGPANDIVVSWSPNTEANLRGYQVRYVVDKGDGAPLTQSIDAGNQTSLRLMNLANLTKYRVAVVAYGSRDVPDPNNPGQTMTESRPGELSAVGSATTGMGMPPVVELTSPNGGETLPADADVTISWQVDRSNDILSQSVELSIDDGATYYPLQTNLDGTVRNIRWHVPPVQATKVRVRVTATDRAGNAGSDTSDAAFAFAPPTGTPVQVTGRLLTPDGRGLKNATVSLTDSLGVTRSVISSPLGFFSFTGVATGGTYTVKPTSKRYRFQQRSVKVDNDLALADFIALE